MDPRLRYAYRPVHVGGFFGDLGSVVTFPFRAAASAIDTATSVIPGGDWIKRAYDQGATYLADVARWDVGVRPFGVPLGQWVLLTISGNVSAAVAGLQVPGEASLVDQIAPALAELTWAMPTFMAERGQCFNGAYVQAFSQRFALLMKLCPGCLGTMTDQVSGLINDPAFMSAVDPAKVAAVQDAAKAAGKPVPSAADALSSLGLGPNALAARFHVRADSVALALQLVYCAPVYDVSTFDGATGANPHESFVVPTDTPLGVLMKDPLAFRLKPVPRLPDGATSTDILTVILTAENSGVPEDKLSDLKAQFQEVMASEAAGTSPSQVAFKARVAAAHGQFSAAPEPSWLSQALTFALLTAPLWGTVLYLRGKKA